jgi:hypothetical protein
MSEVPLCAEHADWMTEAVPLPDVNADPVEEMEKLRASIEAAHAELRNDAEWSIQAYERKPELN